MRKLISAVFLALMALIQVHAQDSDLRSAPDLPTFKVTLNYSASEGGTITSDISSGAKVAYNTAPKFTITANAGYVLADITTRHGRKVQRAHNQGRDGHASRHRQEIRL